MKKLILTLTTLYYVISGMAQEGSSCTNPKILTVNDSICSWTFPPNGKEFGINFDTIPFGFYHNRKVVPRVKVWYKFNAVSKNVGLRVKESRNYSVLILSGVCGNFDTLWSNSSYLPSNFFFEGDSKEPMYGFGENLTIGQDYFIQVCFTENPVLYREQLCLFKLPDVGQKIFSVPGNGLWHNKSSWIQNRIPFPIDTVVISDGSNITINQTSDIAIKSLIIGNNLPQVAKLYVQSWSNNFWIYGDIKISSGDSLIGNPNASYSDRYRVHGNMQLDGVFKCFKKNQTSSFKPVLNFKSFKKQIVTGQGQFLGCGIPGLIIDNPRGVKWNIDGYCRSQIYLKSGLFDNIESTISFHYDTLNMPYDGTRPSVSIESGFLAKKIPGVSINFFGQKSNFFVSCQVKDDDQNINYDINLEDFFPPKPSFQNFRLSKWSGKKVICSHSLFIYSIDFSDGGILQGNQIDTLTFLNNTSMSYSTPNTHVEFGVYRNIYRNSGSGTWQVPAWAGGKARSFAFVDYLANAPAGNVIQVRIKTTPPGGAVVAPATFMMGPHVVEVTSNTALAAATKLRLEVYDTDSLVGLKNSWRIAQAPTPNGPWTPLAVTHTYVAANDPILDAIMTTTNPISLANGHYFAFASVGNPTDAVLSRVIPIPTYGFGCNANQYTTVKMLVNNNGLSPLTEVLAGALVNGSLYSQSYTVGSNWSALAVGATDTLRFSMPGDVAVNGPVKFFVSATGEGNRSNDTLKVRLNTLPTPLPALITFDTCKYLGLNIAGLPKYGYPIVAGWENAPIVPPNVSTGTNGNAFVTVQTVPLPTNNRFHLMGQLYLPYGRTHFRSANFGPIGNSSWLTYKFNIVDSEISNEIRSTDTLTMEASNDCGQTYIPLRIINRSNFTQYLDPGALLNSNGNLSPPSTWWDSLPFPPGSMVHFRFRLKTVQSINTFGLISLDNIRFIDTLFTGLRPDQERAQQMLLYPNPAKEEVFLSLPGDEPITGLCLVDALGRRLPLALPPPKSPASLRGIPPGVYLLEAQTASQRYQKRLLVR